MAIPIFLWPIIAQGAGIVAKSFTAPKKKDYTPNLGYIRKYMAYLKGKKTDNEVYQSILRPQLRAIGQQQNLSLSKNREVYARQGMTDSGAEAQQTQNIITGATGQMQGVQEQATGQQILYNRQVDDKVQSANLEMGRIEDQARQEYQRAKNQWQAGLIGDIANLGVSAAMTIGQQYTAAKNTYETAKATGIISEDTSFQDYRKSMGAAGYDSGQAYVQGLQRERGMENTNAIIGAIYPSAASMIANNPKLDGLSPEQKLQVAKYYTAASEGKITQEYATYMLHQAQGAPPETLLDDFKTAVKNGSLTAPQASQISLHLLAEQRATQEAAQKAQGVPQAKPADIERSRRSVGRAIFEFNYALANSDGKILFKDDASEKAYLELFGDSENPDNLGLLTNNYGLSSTDENWAAIMRNVRTVVDAADLTKMVKNNSFTLYAGTKQEITLNYGAGASEEEKLAYAREELYKNTVDLLQKAFDYAKVVGEYEVTEADAAAINRNLAQPQPQPQPSAPASAPAPASPQVPVQASVSAPLQLQPQASAPASPQPSAPASAPASAPPSAMPPTQAQAQELAWELEQAQKQARAQAMASAPASAPASAMPKGGADTPELLATARNIAPGAVAFLEEYEDLGDPELFRKVVAILGYDPKAVTQKDVNTLLKMVDKYARTIEFPKEELDLKTLSFGTSIRAGFYVTPEQLKKALRYDFKTKFDLELQKDMVSHGNIVRYITAAKYSE